MPKIKCEELVNSYHDKIETVIIRPGFNIYGPNDRMTSMELLHRLEHGKLIGYVNKGDARLGYVYSENLAFGLFCAGTHKNAAGNTYIIADTEPPYLHFKNLLQLFSKELKIVPKLSAVPSFVLMPLAFLLDAFYFIFSEKKMPLISTYIVNTSIHNLQFSPAKAIKEIGYKQEVGFEEGIRRTVGWYKKLKENNVRSAQPG